METKYYLPQESKDMILQIDSKLNLVEVKGDSVMYLSAIRVMIKQLYDSIQEETEKPEGG